MKSLAREGERGVSRHGFVRPGAESTPPLLLLIEETQTLLRSVGSLCDYLGVQTRRLGMSDDLRPVFTGARPIGALIFLGDQPMEVGCRFLEEWLKHDRDLPLILVTGTASAWGGAAEAVTAKLGLRSARVMTSPPEIGDLADFIVDGARRHRERRGG